jgi:hypothetical protein
MYTNVKPSVVLASIGHLDGDQADVLVDVLPLLQLGAERLVGLLWVTSHTLDHENIPCGQPIKC